jgi:hypothetical protein
MNLNGIFHSIVAEGDTVAVPVADKRQYDNLRTALVRKFSTYRKQCQEIGLESYDDKFMSCSLDSGTLTATFSLKWKEESKRVAKQYAAFKL